MTHCFCDFFLHRLTAVVKRTCIGGECHIRPIGNYFDKISYSYLLTINIVCELDGSNRVFLGSVILSFAMPQIVNVFSR